MNQKFIKQQIVLGAVVVNDGKVLILQRSLDESVFPGIWELPSGKREPLEDSEAALIREIAEETGLRVKIKAVVSVFDYQVGKSDHVRDSTQINFLVEIEDGNPLVQISEEHQSFAWIGENEIENFDITEAVKQVIFQSFSLMNQLSLI